MNFKDTGKCAHCPRPVEAAHYSMCYDCWWVRDPRNKEAMIAQIIRPKNFDLASIDPPLSVSQRVSYGHMSATVETTVNVDGELFRELEVEAWNNTINEYMEAHGLGLG